MKELPRKLSRFVVAHGPQGLILLVGGAALVLGGMFVLGNPVLGLSTQGDGSSGTGSGALVQQDSSVASIKDQDKDKDGLSDLEERLYHTNPESADTDGDGFKDGQEVENGYDPASKLSAGDTPNASGSGSASASLLSLLSGSSSDQKSADQNSGATSAVGGLGGITDEQAAQLGNAVLPDGQRVADLEVDQILNKGSQPLPTADRKSVKTTKDSSAPRENEYFQAVVKIALTQNPFPAHYSVKSYLADVEAGNRDLFEKMKFADETMLQQLQALTVPESMVDEHLHALSILLASRDALQQVLDSNVSSDSILQLLGRSFFVMGEFQALLKEGLAELQ
ncbi:MAG: hypothetical protein U0517_03805 [Candidatus Andersenbacteria bacterium]